jgi:hypothetical protein
MTARDVIHEIESLPQDERFKVEAWLRARDAAREDAADCAVMKLREDEPSRDLRAILGEIGIKPE